MSWQESREQRRPPSPIQKAVLPATRPAVPTPKPAATPEPEGLIRRFLGRRITIRVVTGEDVVGVLSTIGRFEVAVTISDGSQTVLLKHAVVSITEARP